MSTSTRRSKLRERSSSSQINKETSPGASPLTRTCVGVTTIASATEGSVTETRLRRSVVLMRRDFPTITRSGAAPEVSVDVEVEVVAVAGGATGLSWALEAGLGEVAGDVAASLRSADLFSASPWKAAGRAEIVVAPRNRTAATSLKALMNSDLLQAARATRSKANRKLGGQRQREGPGGK